VVATLLAAMPCAGLSQKPERPKSALQQDEVVAGSDKDFLLVRHVVLLGSNEAIGRELAEIARQRHQGSPLSSQDPFRTRVQRRYIEKHYPALHERMRGVAAAFGRQLDDDAWNFSGLGLVPLGLGCSVIHLPPNRTASGSSVVSRDYDFSTGTLQGTWPKRGELPATARPYLIEMYPERGYASLAVYAYDLVSGVLDGINSEGLTVALLADDELLSKYPMEPAGTEGVGLGVLQVLRFLLDTCATVEEAKEALLLTKQYYEFVPVHYLVADRYGKAFVWEYSQAHNKEYIVENSGQPLITTNFSLHRYLEANKPPSIKRAEKICPRYCALAERLVGHEGKLSVDFVKETHKLVDATRPSAKDAPRPPGRTLWHALYFPEERKMQVSFYLRDAADPDQPDKVRIVRSDYREFSLRSAKPGK
jgi:hypothetical protein